MTIDNCKSALLNMTQRLKSHPSQADKSQNCRDQIELGHGHLKSGRYREAAILASNAVDLEPANAFARLILGVAYSRLGQGKESIEQLQQAANLAPENVEIRYNLAVTLAENGKNDMAMVEYAACLDRDPNFADALWNYGEMLRLREHFGKALECFDCLLSIEGQMRDKMAHRTAVCCAQLGLSERADALFVQQISEDDDPHTHWEYAHFVLGRGRFKEAWPHYARRFEAGPKISVYCGTYPFEYWGGQFQRGAGLLVHGEQG